jgi:hypothetical protein
MLRLMDNTGTLPENRIANVTPTAADMNRLIEFSSSRKTQRYEPTLYFSCPEGGARVAMSLSETFFRNVNGHQAWNFK